MIITKKKMNSLIEKSVCEALEKDYETRMQAEETKRVIDAQIKFNNSIVKTVKGVQAELEELKKQLDKFQCGVELLPLKKKTGLSLWGTKKSE